jgi:hypothetical protein
MPVNLLNLLQVMVLTLPNTTGICLVPAIAAVNCTYVNLYRYLKLAWVEVHSNDALVFQLSPHAAAGYAIGVYRTAQVQKNKHQMHGV